MFDQQVAHIRARVRAGYEEALEAADRPSEADKVGVGEVYLFFLFGGLFGAHRMLMGRRWWTILPFAVTGGYFMFGWLYDLCTIPDQVKDINKKVDRAIQRDRERHLSKK